MDAGKAWGSMPKVELTDQLRNDLKAIKFRNQIFSKKFYKKNDSEKLPQYFQIATVIDDGVGFRKNDKRVKASSIADQFLREDDAIGFSKKKYECFSDRFSFKLKQSIDINYLFFLSILIYMLSAIYQLFQLM